MLNNIADNLEQCGQQNIVQCCFYCSISSGYDTDVECINQPIGYGCIFISVLMILSLMVLQNIVVSLLLHDVNTPLRLESRQFSNHQPPW